MGFTLSSSAGCFSCRQRTLRRSSYGTAVVQSKMPRHVCGGLLMYMPAQKLTSRQLTAEPRPSKRRGTRPSRQDASKTKSSNHNEYQAYQPPPTKLLRYCWRIQMQRLCQAGRLDPYLFGIEHGRMVATEVCKDTTTQVAYKHCIEALRGHSGMALSKPDILFLSSNTYSWFRKSYKTPARQLRVFDLINWAPSEQSC